MDKRLGSSDKTAGQGSPIPQGERDAKEPGNVYGRGRVAIGFGLGDGDATPLELRLIIIGFVLPGLKQPWAAIRERFQR